jgi:L-ornithine N5-oxygenase
MIGWESNNGSRSVVRSRAGIEYESAEREVQVLGIGAGPSNLALAVALEEVAPDHLARNTLLLEQHPDVKWHRNMLLPWVQSQVSFLKDLVTLRNPRSRFSFLNYLHDQGRLNDFVNLGSFTPYRVEISEYLQWVANSLDKVKVEYEQRCVGVEARWHDDGRLRGWRVRLQDGSTITSRDLVVAAGRDPHIPDVFRALPVERVVHSTQYRARIDDLDTDLPFRVVVVGGAQSAAEMFRAVHDDLPNCKPTIVMRAVGFMTYETSPFTNELFYPSFVDEFFEMSHESRLRTLQEMRRTNYAGLTPELLEELYRLLYLQRLHQEHRTRVVTMTEVVGARMAEGEVRLELRDQRTGRSEHMACDLVLLGTGYEKGMPGLAREVAAALGCGELRLTRNYRVALERSGEGAAYLLGVNEETHGMADSLLSVLAHRSEEIVNDMLARRRTGSLHLGRPAAVGRPA